MLDAAFKKITWDKNTVMLSCIVHSGLMIYKKTDVIPLPKATTIRCTQHYISLPVLGDHPSSVMCNHPELVPGTEMPSPGRPDLKFNTHTHA